MPSKLVYRLLTSDLRSRRWRNGPYEGFWMQHEWLFRVSATLLNTPQNGFHRCLIGHEAIAAGCRSEVPASDVLPMAMCLERRYERAIPDGVAECMADDRARRSSSLTSCRHGAWETFSKPSMRSRSLASRSLSRSDREPARCLDMRNNIARCGLSAFQNIQSPTVAASGNRARSHEQFGAHLRPSRLFGKVALTATTPSRRLPTNRTIVIAIHVIRHRDPKVESFLKKLQLE